MVTEELWTNGFVYTITILFCLPAGVISQKLDFTNIQSEELCNSFDHLLTNDSHVILPVQLSVMDTPCGINFPRLEFDELLDCICKNNDDTSNLQCVVSWNEDGVGNVYFQHLTFNLRRCENNNFVPFVGLVVACSDSSVISSSTIDRCENVPIPRSDWTCSSLPRTLHLGGDWILQVQQSGNEAEVTVCSYSKSITPTTPTTALTTTTKTAAALTTTTTAAALTTTTTAVALTIAPTIRTSLTTTTTTVPTPYSTSVKNGNMTIGLTSISNIPGSLDSLDKSDDKLKIIIISIVTSIIALTAIILTVIFIIRKRNKQQNMSSKDVEHNRDTPAQPESVGLNGTTNMAYEDPCDSEEPYGPVHLSSPNIDNNPNFDSSYSPYCNNPVDISNPDLDDRTNFDCTPSASYYNDGVHLPNLDHSPDFDSTSASYYNGPVHLPTLDHNPDFDGTSTSYCNTLT